MVARLLVPLMVALAAVPAWAEVYKWVDDSGTVNYSNLPPANPAVAKKTQLVPDKVSVISPDPAVVRAMQAGQSTRDRALAEKVDRLERQLDAERHARQAAGAAAAQAEQAAYDRCVLDRNVDCSGGYSSYYPYAVPAVVVRAPRIAPTIPIARPHISSRSVAFRSVPRSHSGNNLPLR